MQGGAGEAGPEAGPAGRFRRRTGGEYRGLTGDALQAHMRPGSPREARGCRTRGRAGRVMVGFTHPTHRRRVGETHRSSTLRQPWRATLPRMSNCIRARAPRASFFFTVNLARRGDDLLVRRIEALRSAWRQTHRAMPFRCDAMVILPDHLHAVWTPPPGDGDFTTRRKMFKAGVTRLTELSGPRSESKRAKGEKGPWQRRFREHTIRDEADFAAHVTCCRGNPARHGLVRRASEWRFSSIHRDIRAGRVSPEWSGGLADGRYGGQGGSPPLRGTRCRGGAGWHPPYACYDCLFTIERRLAEAVNDPVIPRCLCGQSVNTLIRIRDIAGRCCIGSCVPAGTVNAGRGRSGYRDYA